MKQIVVIAHNIRSAHNVGALFRTAEGLGIDKIYCTGYTPYPAQKKDSRLPHIQKRVDKLIQKTALDAQKYIAWEHTEIESLIPKLKDAGFTIAALEQSKSSVTLQDYKAPQKIALLLGNEVDGVSEDLMDMSDVILEIPMPGLKESFNVVQASAMALFYLKMVQ